MDMKDRIAALADLGKKLNGLVEILNRTTTAGDGTHGCAINSILSVQDSPMLSDEARDMLGEIHLTLYTDAKSRLDAKHAAEVEALCGRAPSLKVRRKAGKKARELKAA